MKKARFIYLAVLVSLFSVVGFGYAQPAKATEDEDRITLCHRTNSVKNPYIEITVSIDGSNGRSLDDHTIHTGPIATSEEVALALKKAKQKWGDIIPPYGDFEGLNWTEAGEELLENGCQEPDITEVMPAVPTFKDATCTTKGSYTIPLKEGVEYSVNGVTKTAGTYEVESGTSVEIVAEATEGYYVPDGTTDSWSHTFNAASGCSTPSVLGSSSSVNRPQVTVTPKGSVNAGEPAANGSVALLGLLGSVFTVGIGLIVSKLHS